MPIAFGSSIQLRSIQPTTLLPDENGTPVVGPWKSVRRALHSTRPQSSKPWRTIGSVAS